MGNPQILFPDGARTIEDVPADLMRAIQHGMRILEWQGNLTDEEMPPHWMWVFDSELDTWFERVIKERKERYGGSGGSGSEDSEMVENEYAKNRR